MNIDLLRKIDRVHPYPAKYPIDLAIEYISKYTGEGDMVYDPFVGSGTTLLASSILKRKGFGTDINHIAVLISQFKLLSLEKKEINNLEAFIQEFEDSYINDMEETKLFYYNSIEHWFCDDSIKILSVIKNKMENLHGNEKIFCKTIMSSIINTVSNQESDTRYAAVVKPNLTSEYVAMVFIKRFKAVLNLFCEFNEIPRSNNMNIVKLLDSKQCGELIEKQSVDLILTSPPYVNTYDYYLYHKHRMNWLDFDVNYSMKAEIGSRREFSSLKKPESKFNEDLYEIFNKCDDVLKPNGVAVIVIGDGKVAGKMYDAKQNMIEIGLSLGWEFIDYSFTNLDETSRAFQQSYRTKGKKEHILTFKKR